jgi:hypothetical protein
MAKMSPKMMKAYAAYEKKEPAATKKKELKKPEGKKEKARELKVGMHMMKGKPMKNSAMKKKGKK